MGSGLEQPAVSIATVVTHTLLLLIYCLSSALFGLSDATIEGVTGIKHTSCELCSCDQLLDCKKHIGKRPASGFYLMAALPV
eukprot:4463850-Pleurochrysis_carterae.AAC.1